jgi:hypothetical protein
MLVAPGKITKVAGELERIHQGALDRMLGGVNRKKLVMEL